MQPPPEGGPQKKISETGPEGTKNPNLEGRGGACAWTADGAGSRLRKRATEECFEIVLGRIQPRQANKVRKGGGVGGTFVTKPSKPALRHPGLSPGDRTYKQEEGEEID